MHSFLRALDQVCLTAQLLCAQLQLPDLYPCRDVKSGLTGGSAYFPVRCPSHLCQCHSPTFLRWIVIFFLSEVSSGAKCDIILSQSSTIAMGPPITCKQRKREQWKSAPAHKSFLKHLVLCRKRAVGTQDFCFSLLSSLEHVPGSFSKEINLAVRETCWFCKKPLSHYGNKELNKLLERK